MQLIVVIILVYFLTTLLGYLVHWSFHQKWMRGFYVSHMKHHELYFGDDYVSDIYRSSGKDNTVILFIIPAIIMLSIPAILFLVKTIPLYILCVIVMEMSIIAWLHNYLHESFHVRNHFLKRISFIKYIFDKWMRDHYIHHNDLSKNFGIFTFMWDRLFHTYK